MPDSSVFHAALGDLADAMVDRLLRERETRFVERKRQVTGTNLDDAVSSLANTLGGWVLLGVSDDDPPSFHSFDTGRSDV
jgi:predicted HTH transcriptional regulator